MLIFALSKTAVKCKTLLFRVVYLLFTGIYRGHVFWDSEMYILPAILMTQPEMAKYIIRYRASKYEAALAHAKKMGKEGLRFPWESAYSGRLKYIYILSDYSPFSDRVGLPLHNIHIPSPFTSIMDIFFVDLKFVHIRFYTCDADDWVVDTICIASYCQCSSSPTSRRRPLF